MIKLNHEDLSFTLPCELFSSGTIRGCLACGGITVEELHWNQLLGQVNMSLRSPDAREITLRFGPHLRFVHAVDPADRGAITPTSPDAWSIKLTAGRSLRLECRH